MAWCEDLRVDYLFGLAGNSRLPDAIEADLAWAAAEHQETGEPARRFNDFFYATRDSWSRRRRVIGKAEHLAKGANPHFIVTSLKRKAIDAQTLYEQVYCAAAKWRTGSRNAARSGSLSSGRRRGRTRGPIVPRPRRWPQHHRVAPVGLHLVADLAREQRRRHHVAAVPEAGQLTLHVAAGAGFVAKCGPAPRCCGDARRLVSGHAGFHPSTASCTGCAAYPACSQSCRTSAFATASTSATEIVFLCTSKPTKRVRSVMVRLVRCLGTGPDHRSNPRQRCYTP